MGLAVHGVINEAIMDSAANDPSREMGRRERHYTDGNPALVHLVLLPSNKMEWEDWDDAIFGIAIFMRTWEPVELFFDVVSTTRGRVGVGYLEKGSL